MIKRKKTFFLGIAVLVLSVVAVMADPPDQAYITNFGWGKVLISDKDFPGLGKCDLGLFNVKNGVFQITAGEGAKLNCRILTKDGKTFGYYLGKLKQANQKSMATHKYDYIRHRIYVSNDHTGKQFYTTWPTGMTTKPGWEPIGAVENNWVEENQMWTSCGIVSDDIPAGLNSWLADARLGYRAYIVTTVGFVRDATEQKYWDKSLLQWMVPIEYIDSEPIAAGTFEVAASTNPMAAWSYEIVKMPAAMDNVAEGEIKVFKSKEYYCTFTFTMKQTYENKNKGGGNFELGVTKKKGAGEDVDTYLGGSLLYGVPSVQQAIYQAFYSAINAGISKQVIPK